MHYAIVLYRKSVQMETVYNETLSEIVSCHGLDKWIWPSIVKYLFKTELIQYGNEIKIVQITTAVKIWNLSCLLHIVQYNIIYSIIV